MNFLKGITNFVEDAADYVMGDALGDISDFVIGVEQFEDGGSSIGYSGGIMGFLDSAFDNTTTGSSLLSSGMSLLKTGAGMYLKSQDKPTFTNPQMQRPDIIRGRMQPSQVTPSAVRNPVGLNNAQVQSAMRRMSQRTNVSPQLQRIVDANMTTRQGRRTIGVGSTSMPRVAPAAPAAVRKTTTTTEVS